MNDVLPALLPVHLRDLLKNVIFALLVLDYDIFWTTFLFALLIMLPLVFDSFFLTTTSIFDRSLERHFNFALDFEWLFHRLSISTITARLGQIFERLFTCTTFTTRYFERFFTHEQILKCFTCTFLLHFFIKLLLTCITTTTTRSSQISERLFFSHYYSIYTIYAILL